MVNILDCTMRDGGYYNDWDFSREFAEDYLELASSVGLQYLELGFRSYKESGHRGPWAYTPDTLIKSFDLPKNSKIGVMINASEFIQGGLEALERVFPGESPIDFVRVALHYSEISNSAPIVKYLASQGLSIGLNLMQASERTMGEIAEFGILAKKLAVHFAYLADSLGSMDPDSVQKSISILKEASDISVGFHAHDNQGYALQNSMAAIQAGAEFIDGTMLGMGRGAGNAKTEDILATLLGIENAESMPKVLARVNDFLGKHMHPLREKSSWGPSMEYLLASKWGVHPTYAQELISEHGRSGDVILKLFDLSLVNSKRFNSDLLKPAAVQAEEAKVSSHLRKVAGNSVLIAGAGPTVFAHSRELENFCLRNDLPVFALNNSWDLPRNERLDVYQVSLAEVWPSITRNARISGVISPARRDGALSDFDSQVPFKLLGGSWSIKPSEIGIPNKLTLSYALGVAASLSPKTIYFAGIDGYAEDVRNAEIIESISTFSSNFPGVQLISLTPTRLPLDFKSAYWRG